MIRRWAKVALLVAASGKLATAKIMCDVPDRKKRERKITIEEEVSTIRESIAIAVVFIRRYFSAITKTFLRVWLQFFWQNKFFIGVGIFLLLVWWVIVHIFFTAPYREKYWIFPWYLWDSYNLDIHIIKVRSWRKLSCISLDLCAHLLSILGLRLLAHCQSSWSLFLLTNFRIPRRCFEWTPYGRRCFPSASRTTSFFQKFILNEFSRKRVLFRGSGFHHEVFLFPC